MFNRKKGMSNKLWYILWELIAAAAIAFIILATLNTIITKNTFWKKYYSIDLALMADIENINQGDFVMNYNLKEDIDPTLKRYLLLPNNPLFVGLNNFSVDVYEEENGKMKNPTTYAFSKSKNIFVEESLTSSKFLVMSKKGNVLKLSDYDIDTSDICPSYETSGNIGGMKIYSYYNGNNIKSYSDTAQALLNRYGSKGNNASKVMLYYEANINTTIYYSDDVNTLKSQKLACIIKMKLQEKLNNDILLKKYDKSLDQYFGMYINNANEFWVIIKISDENLKEINNNDYAVLIEKSYIEFFT